MMIFSTLIRLIETARCWLEEDSLSDNKSNTSASESNSNTSTIDGRDNSDEEGSDSP
jgi:hypothetical protein